jgi:uncharacterized protein (TIGR03435 family)
MFRQVSKLLPILACFVLIAHAADNHPKFEVASVKVAQPYDPFHPPGPGCSMCGGPGSNDPGEITWYVVQLSTIIERAYNFLPRDRISGPSLLDTGIYSIVAKLPPKTTEEQFQLMLQDLLVARFHFAAHHATREFPGYDLVVAKGGPKLKPWHPDAAFLSVKPQDAGGPKGVDKDGFTILGPGQRIMMPVANGVVRASMRFSMASFASQLGLMVRLSNGAGDTPRVVDRTGLAGEFELRLMFTMGLTPSQEAAGASEPTGAPTIFAALQDQLGLKLVKTKNVTEDLLVIDHVDKIPTRN